MKGFKPTGYGPSAGFKFPARMGFTGSTGAYTNVSPYTRRKAFADGGVVRQDNPRMKSEVIGDQGSALIRRAKPYNNLDQESGGKSPLRPGYRRGGRAKKRMRKAGGGRMDGLVDANMDNLPATDADADHFKANVRSLGKRIDEYRENAKTTGYSGWNQLAKKTQEQMRKYPAPKSMDESWRHKAHGKADGGNVRRDPGYLPRRERPYTFGQSLKAVPAALGMAVGTVPRLIKDAASRAMTRTQQDVAEGKRRRIDAAVDGDLASNYARGGKVKRARGGLAPMIGRAIRARQMQRQPAAPPPQMMRDQMMRRPDAEMPMAGSMQEMGPRDSQGVPLSMYNTPPPATYATPPRVQLGSAPMYRAKGGGARKRMGYETGGSAKKK